MRDQAQNQAETIGALEEGTAFTIKTFPRNLGMVELAHAVDQYRQAVQQSAQPSKTVEVANGR